MAMTAAQAEKHAEGHVPQEDFATRRRGLRQRREHKHDRGDKGDGGDRRQREQEGAKQKPPRRVDQKLADKEEEERGWQW